MDLRGSSAIVTGGAGGLGAAAVRQLVSAGAKVVVADLSEPQGQALVADLGSNVAHFCRTDVLDDEAVRAALAMARGLGPLRLAVSAHGAPTARSRVLARDGEPYALDLFRRTIEVYLIGSFNVLRLAAAEMAKTEPLDSGQRGLIVNTSSIAAFEGQVGQSDYSAAKAGLIGLGLVAARDLAPLGIRVMTIAPGVFYTPAYGMDRESAEAKWGTDVPNPRRMGHPDEYGLLVRQVAENDYLNGEVIRIDGAHRFGPK